MTNPIPADEKSVAKGAQLFAIYCVPCHGKSGTGDGYVGAKLITQAFRLDFGRFGGQA
ncbi:MAG: c-type cytochrome [Nitrosomonadales bacterium]